MLVLVLRRCNLYWGKNKDIVEDRAILRNGLRLIPKLGKAYLISVGHTETIIIQRNGAATGRLIVFQGPESSLCETLRH